MAQAKLVRCVSGRINDFAMDIEPNIPPTFGQVVGVELTPESGQALYIPNRLRTWFFLALEDNTRVLYKVDAPYAPESERAYNYQHPALLSEMKIPTPQPTYRFFPTKDQEPHHTYYKNDEICW